MTRNMQDPTREEMLTFLARIPFANEFDEHDREEAIYWFANDWHGGQWSNLYSALSTSPFKPSICASGVEPDSPAKFLYEELESNFERWP